MDPDSPKPIRRRWFQIGLGTLFVLTTVSALTVVVAQDRARQKALEAEIVELRQQWKTDVVKLQADIQRQQALVDLSTGRRKKNVAMLEEELSRLGEADAREAPQGTSQLIEPYRREKRNRGNR